jgi:hypothetical protein
MSTTTSMLLCGRSLTCIETRLIRGLSLLQTIMLFLLLCSGRKVHAMLLLKLAATCVRTLLERVRSMCVS